MGRFTVSPLDFFSVISCFFFFFFYLQKVVVGQRWTEKEIQQYAECLLQALSNSFRKVDRILFSPQTFELKITFKRPIHLQFNCAVCLSLKLSKNLYSYLNWTCGPLHCFPLDFFSVLSVFCSRRFSLDKDGPKKKSSNMLYACCGHWATLLEKWIEDWLSLNEREKGLFFLNFDRGWTTN